MHGSGGCRVPLLEATTSERPWDSATQAERSRTREPLFGVARTGSARQMDRWKGRVALVTGASVGIGAAVARALVQQGMRVVGCARNVDKIEVGNLTSCDKQR